MSASVIQHPASLMRRDPAGAEAAWMRYCEAVMAFQAKRGGATAAEMARAYAALVATMAAEDASA